MFNHEEQEQVDAIKAWWKQNGVMVTVVVIAFMSAVLGYEGWHWYKDGQTRQASTLFSALEQAVDAQDAGRAREIAGQLMENFPRTPYASRAALAVAGLNSGLGDGQSAAAQLGWVLEHAREPSLKAMAALQLAALQLGEGRHDEALQTLQGMPADHPFPGLSADLRGDILAAQGQSGQARDAYDQALTALGEDSPYRQMVVAKRDALGA